MESYTQYHPWKIIQDSLEDEAHFISESLMSIGNGRMGQRANFPEAYTGPHLQGSYIAGVYYPDKTRVGWWKNGYPEYFAKVLNSVNWIGIQLIINETKIDLHKTKVLTYHRELDMKEGVLRRHLQIQPQPGLLLEIISERFYSIVHQDLAFQKYEIKVLKGNCSVTITPYLDFNIRNSDANYDEDFWQSREEKQLNGTLLVQAVTRKTNFHVSAAMKCSVEATGIGLQENEKIEKGYAEKSYSANLSESQSVKLTKYVAIASSMYYEKEVCGTKAHQLVSQGIKTGYEEHLELQKAAWQKRWAQNDIIIEGDVSAQQGIRFNTYQLYQTYSGEDARLNIGPKGFTGEKYGGSTYWDTEAYCLPFYMGTTDQEVARNLVIYRYKHLPKAIENAEKLGFTKGAALYPMVTMTGEECHNEWEITFEEIHRNGAIAFAIHDYLRYYNDPTYISDYGIDVLVGISRFWAQRVNWSAHREQYVMLGVTGPNEYENNVNNNWYTNYIARWCLEYTLTSLEGIKSDQTTYDAIISRLGINKESDLDLWKDIIAKMYLPKDEELGVFLQQDGFLDKEDKTVADLREEDRPINQKWSWDRILRSPFIKQADVLQGLYFFQDQFSIEELQRNFDFYEPKTVHESSLSPCVHSILASRLGRKEKAYKMYLRTARLDLDNYNNDTEDGCHITSMAGTWMSIVEGFAGMKKGSDYLSFSPFLPEQWKAYSFLRQDLLL